MDQNGEIKIEKGIPVGRGRGVAREVADKMNVGDSVLFPTRKDAERMRWLLKTAGFGVATRNVEGGVRVWRTA